jgi:hypothetical protein
MATFVKKSIRSLAWIIGSIILGFIITMFIAMPYEGRLDELPFGENAPYIVWGIGFIATAIPLRKFVNNQVNIQKSSSWGPPERIRDRVISTPQFVGRLNRDKGLLESTARMVMPDSINKGTWFSERGVQYRVLSLRGELLDQNGSPLEYISVRIMAEESKWVGEIVDGDRIRVEGKFESDGILHTDRAFNYSTNSWVGLPG